MDANKKVFNFANMMEVTIVICVAVIVRGLGVAQFVHFVQMIKDKVASHIANIKMLHKLTIGMASKEATQIQELGDIILFMFATLMLQHTG